MKKILSLILCVLLVGCSSNTVSKSDYDVLLKEKNTLELEVNNLKKTNEKLQESNLKKEVDSLEKQLLNVNLELSKLKERLDNEISDIKISGGFVATLRHLMPDYGLDDRVIGIAIVQWFQGDTFVVRIDSEVAKKLEIGKTYYFEIKEKVIQGHTLNEVKDLVYSENHMIQVINTRLPKEDELGLASPTVNVEKVK